MKKDVLQGTNSIYPKTLKAPECVQCAQQRSKHLRYNNKVHGYSSLLRLGTVDWLPSVHVIVAFGLNILNFNLEKYTYKLI